MIVIITTTTTTTTTTIIITLSPHGVVVQEVDKINWSTCWDPKLDVQKTKGEIQTSNIIMILVIITPPPPPSSSHCHRTVLLSRRWTRSTGARAGTPSWTYRTRRASRRCPNGESWNSALTERCTWWKNAE